MDFTCGVLGESHGETRALSLLTIQHGLPQPSFGASWPHQLPLVPGLDPKISQKDVQSFKPTPWSPGFKTQPFKINHLVSRISSLQRWDTMNRL